MLATIRVSLFALRVNKRDNLDAMLATRTTRPSAFHASKVNTFSRGLMSHSAMPFCANPRKIAGKLLNDWPEIARVSASSLERCATVALASISLGLALGVRLCRVLWHPAGPREVAVLRATFTP